MMFTRNRLLLIFAFIFTDGIPRSVSGSLKEDMNDLERSLNLLCQMDRHIPFAFSKNEYSNSTSLPEFDANTVELARLYGYDMELHEITTEDGYILTHFRIPGKKGLSEITGKMPILLVHGFLENSDHWLLLGKKSLAFMLADEGYDVWMANVRGATYSKQHKSMSVDNPNFWQFTWHEMGVYDIPATIDYILKETGKEKLVYLGYSTGTTIFFVLMSEKPEYNNKIVTMIAFAPIVFWNHIGILPRTVIFDASPMAYDFAAAYEQIPLLSFGGFLLQCVKRICRTPVLSEQVCIPILTGMFGFNTNEEDKYMLPIFSNHLSSAGLKQVVHFGQVGLYKRFQKYKYPSPDTNMKKYGSVNPPTYKLENVKIPLMLFTANKDPLGNEMNVRDLKKALRTEVLHEQVKDENFDHNSFTWGHNATTILYPRVLSLLKKYMR